MRSTIFFFCVLLVYDIFGQNSKSCHRLTEELIAKDHFKQAEITSFLKKSSMELKEVFKAYRLQSLDYTSLNKVERWQERDLHTGYILNNIEKELDEIIKKFEILLR